MVYKAKPVSMLALRQSRYPARYLRAGVRRRRDDDGEVIWPRSRWKP